MLKNRNFSRYIQYAIGEVLLIVIGVSIAVYINKYVESENQNKLLTTILSNISSDIETDIKEVDIILDSYEKKDKLYSYILDSLDLGKSIKDCISCPSVLTSAVPFSIRTKGYHQLLNFNEYGVSQKDSLIFNLSNFYSSYTSLTETVNKLILDETKDNLNYLKKNYPHFKFMFYSEDKKVEGRMDFFENNVEFINRVALSELIDNSNHVPFLEAYKKDSKVMLDKISKRLKK